MMKLIVVSFVVVTLIGVVAGFDSNDDDERKGNGIVCPVHTKPSGGPGWNPPDNCKTECAGRTDGKTEACCCKECGTYGNGDCDCHCCEPSVNCRGSENLNKPNNAACINLNKKGRALI